MPTVRWSNGHIDRADTWDELLDHVRTTQMREYTEDEFRAVLATRAYRWTLHKIDPELPADELFAELAHAKLVEMLDDSTDYGKGK